MCWMIRGLLVVCVLGMVGCSGSPPDAPTPAGNGQSYDSEMEQLADQWDESDTGNTTSADAAETQ